MNYSKNRKDLATLAGARRMREQAKKDYEKGLQDLEENSMYSIGYKREMAQKAKQELEKKVAEYDTLATSTMKQIFDRVYSPDLTVDSDFTNLLTFIKACGDSLSKEQITQLAQPFRGQMAQLKLIESVAKSSGIENVDLIFERDFYFHQKNRQPTGSVPDGYTKDEYLKNWQSSFLTGDDSTFTYRFDEVCRKLGEDIQSPVQGQEFEMPPIL